MSGVDFDPWAGQHLGAVQKPPGFDEFWEEQEAIHRGEKQPADFQSETGHQGQRGKGNRPKGKGRGKRRYNVPEQRAPRARPTHFVAIRLFSRMIRRNVQQMQQWFIAKNPLFEQCVVPVRRLHSSLLLTSIPADKKGEAQEANTVVSPTHQPQRQQIMETCTCARIHFGYIQCTIVRACILISVCACVHMHVCR